ncbi:MAG: GNAT family N-acetyltransferase [bacterium]
MASESGQTSVAAYEFESKDGKNIVVRPVRDDDRAALEDMFRSCSSDTLYTRFLSPGVRVPLRYLDRLMIHRPPGIVSLVALEGENVIGLLNFVRYEQGESGEIAIVVRDEYQNRGVGSGMLRFLYELARGHGVKKFVADIDAGNRRVFHLIQRSGFSSRIEINQGVAHVELYMEKSAETG